MCTYMLRFVSFWGCLLVCKSVCLFVYLLLYIMKCIIDRTMSVEQVARSWSTQLTLMEEHPELEWIFVASQAVQYEWLREDHPDLFLRLKKLIMSSNSNNVNEGVVRLLILNRAVSKLFYIPWIT